MPEATITHHRDGTLARWCIERRGSCTAQAIAHGGVTNIERRQDGEQVAANVSAHVVLTQLALHQLHGAENRPLRAPCTKSWWTLMHAGCQWQQLTLGHQRNNFARLGGRQSRDRLDGGNTSVFFSKGTCRTQQDLG